MLEATLCYRPQVCNFIKKKAMAQVFSCEFCKVSKNIFFTGHLCTPLGSLNIPIFIERRKMEMDFKARIHCEIFVSEHFMKYGFRGIS